MASGSAPTDQTPPTDKNTEGTEKRPVRIAVAGCSHGEMDAIYAALARMEQQRGYKVDLLICCGDFQAVRNYGDLWTMACPEKYLHLQTFYKYYSGEVTAPVLTIFVGGNHEASGYMQELPYGGWVAPNIYYMGWASSVLFGGLRIVGCSGIFNTKGHTKGHFECPPFNRDTLRTVYYTRAADVFRLRQLRAVPVDVVFTHDWPLDITHYGDKERLFRFKKHLRADAESGELGSKQYMQLLHEVKPRRWFAAHLHCRFEAAIKHDTDQLTRFLALDKPIPGRQFLDIIEMETSETLPPSGQIRLEYDPVWCAVLRNTDHLMSYKFAQHYMPTPAAKDRWDFQPTDDELSAVYVILEHSDIVKYIDGHHYINNEFCRTAPVHANGETLHNCGGQTAYYRNPQSTRFAKMLNVQDFNGLLYDANKSRQPGTTARSHASTQPQKQQFGPDSNPETALNASDTDGSLSTSHFDQSLFDREDFGDSDFVLDHGPMKGAAGFEAPKLVKRKSDQLDGDESLVGSSSVSQQSGVDLDTPSKVCALAKMKRRNRDSLPVNESD